MPKQSDDPSREGEQSHKTDKGFEVPVPPLGTSAGSVTDSSVRYSVQVATIEPPH